jgi:hypothetical protein
MICKYCIIYIYRQTETQENGNGAPESHAAGTQFTSFTGTKVQILTLRTRILPEQPLKMAKT